MKLTIIFLFILVSLSAQEYQVDKAKENLVKFISDAPIESFEGTTNNIDGYLFLTSFDDLTKNQLYFEVDLNTLDTGIGLRNRHMRENYLETEKYRYAFFDGKIIEIKQEKDNEYSVLVEGDMNIHGKTKKLSISGKIINEKDLLRVKTNFDVSLSDYEVEIPKLMFMKINEVIKLELNFYLKRFESN